MPVGREWDFPSPDHSSDPAPLHPPLVPLISSLLGPPTTLEPEAEPPSAVGLNEFVSSYIKCQRAPMPIHSDTSLTTVPPLESAPVPERSSQHPSGSLFAVSSTVSPLSSPLL